LCISSRTARKAPSGCAAGSSIFDALLENASKIKARGNALGTDADLLIYGCDVAQSDAAGRSLIDALSRFTGVDDAGSDDLTGHAALGGDWESEYRVGSITVRATGAAGQVVFVQDGSAQAPSYALVLSDGVTTVGPFAGSVTFSAGALPVEDTTKDRDAPPAEVPPVLDFAPLEAAVVAPAAPSFEPLMPAEFSPGRPDSNFNDILAQTVELKSAQARPLPKLVQPVLSFNE
jgi:hypothetical protein